MCQLSSSSLYCHEQPKNKQSPVSPPASPWLLLHLPGCSWRVAGEACGILGTCGSGRERWGTGQEGFLWGTYGSSSLTARPASQMEPWGCQGTWGPTAGTKAGQAELAGTGPTTVCLLHQPCICTQQASGHLGSAIWPRLGVRHPQHGQTDAVLPEEMLSHTDPHRLVVLPLLWQCSTADCSEESWVRGASLAETNTEGSTLTLAFTGEIPPGPSLENAACTQLCHMAHDFPPCAPAWNCCQHWEAV